MRLKFWGVRGSTPTPQAENLRYGGNTSCVEVRFGDSIYIFDCGTGFRVLGHQLESEFGERPFSAHVFVSHFHWDHIQGIPFFRPLYDNPNTQFSFHYSSRVRSLILAASGSGVAAMPGPACVPGLPEQLATAVVARGVEGYVHHEICETATYFTDAYRAAHPDQVRAFYELAWRRHARQEQFVRLCIARHTWEATHRLGDVAVPTLVVVGDGDVIGRSHVPQAEVLARRIPGAEYKVLVGQSHGFFWQVPDETNAWILDWVRRHAVAA